jgi:hypothetical protein
VSVSAPAREAELERLYRRFKALALGVSAALMLDRGLGKLAEDSASLLQESLRAAEQTDDPGSPFGACVAAAMALCALVQRAAAGEPTAVELAELRTAHTRLRREVWAVVPCEYVPCCVSGAHHEARGVK